MSVRTFFDRLSVRLTAAFLLAAVLGVTLVALLAFRSTSSEFDTFVRHMGRMQQMMGGASVSEAQADFVDNLGRTLWIAGASGVAVAIVLGALFTRQIVAPLGRVARAARSIAGGQITESVPVSGSGELAELSVSFNAMAESLRRDQRLRRSMVADIAHELRTPLSVLQGNTEAMLDGVMESSRENLEGLHQEALLLGRLVDDLRTLSLAETGELGFQPRAVDLRGLCSRVVDGFQVQARAKRVRLALDMPGDAPDALADPDRTAQVLRNLLGNALGYTPEDGDITVALSAEGDRLTVSVIDSGVGIAEDDLPLVFDRFYRVDRSRSRSTGGSGLGLAIVKQLVEAQGGSVSATSSPGAGSAFSFSLPRAG